MTIMVEAAYDPLDDFIAFLFEGLEGLIYVAAKTLPTGEDDTTMEWKQEFFNYPEDITKVKRVIKEVSKTHEIYLAPALFSSPKATKENFKVSNVIWADFDGTIPDYLELQPSYVIQSSNEDHTHAYWKLTEPVTDINKIEELNRGLMFKFKADSSGWDGTQVLRPPLTVNHKRGGLSVETKAINHIEYDVDVFGELPISMPKEVTWELGSLPSVQDVILKYAFTPDLVQLLQKDRADIKDRSISLTNLAYGCCQLGMSDAEVFVIILLAADRWEKFKGRKDKEKQLAKIIGIAREKYPTGDNENDSLDEPFTIALGFESFLSTEISIDWAIEPMLMENGSMILVGPSGIGKTQWSIQVMIHVALGKDFLHYKIPNAKKVLFLSLEMDHGSLKIFLETMSKDLTAAEKALLEQNLIIVPHGEPWALNTPVGQDYLIQIIEQINPDGIFVDSIGSSIKGSLSTDESVQPLLDFNDKIRKKYNLFVWYIHHMRKAHNGGAHTSDQDDIYGNQYLLNRATSSYGLLRSKKHNIRIRNFKLRMSKQEEDYFVIRTENLNFQKSNADIDKMIEHMVYVKDEEDKGPISPPDDKAGKFSL